MQLICVTMSLEAVIKLLNKGPNQEKLFPRIKEFSEKLGVSILNRGNEHYLSS